MAERLVFFSEAVDSMCQDQGSSGSPLRFALLDLGETNELSFWTDCLQSS